MTNKKTVQEAHDALIYLAKLTAKFSDIRRSTVYPDGHFESDVEHSFHLALSATELAAGYHPELDLGLISQFSIVHDLVEVYAGDVPSFKLTDEELLEKERLEKIALRKLVIELPSHTASMLERYEKQVEPEARFVRLVDKLLPPIIHTVAAQANQKKFFNMYDIQTIEDLHTGNARVLKRLQQTYPEFDFLLLLRELTANISTDTFAVLVLNKDERS